MPFGVTWALSQSARPCTEPASRLTTEIASIISHLDPFRVNRPVPEAHRFGVGKAQVHRIRILGAELAQAQATS
jgi:hypothetical protein